jgi:NADPH:quinone reductase-like Zn-dependent oxidoreductase
MRAIAIIDSGAAPALIDVADPKPAPGEVLVRVHASSVATSRSWPACLPAAGGSPPPWALAWTRSDARM